MVRLQFGRRRRGHGHRLTGLRMHELQFLRVQQVTAITGQAGMTLQATAGFIQRITEQRVAGIGHVNADLVRPAGRDLDTEQGLIVALFQERILESELHRFVRFQYDVVVALARAK